ncbi:hypothetical protein [Micromonospora sp. NBRC 101691]|uniref:hypothetical protein n=1 Tax=Micromonospora sp. NBRC 101691 TaxID=3032198 RepID=UPI0024A3CFEF|nr:hypothetical protein [Micromonospora sp. NBRC 101691]GLY24472.1 hypothetical protein Misp04_42040 [Micromonospora sp. NBRC 101691]
MSSAEWPRTPIGIDARKWITRSGCRTALVVVHTMASWQRLLDVVGHIEDDPRVQVVYTVAPDVFNQQVRRHLDRAGAFVLPWPQAVREPFDLALAASLGGLHQVHAPILVMPHGAGHGKRVRPDRLGGTSVAEPPVYGLDAQRLTHDGRVVPAALALAHENELAVLRRQCPEAVPAAVVVGDPCFDRLTASQPSRERYRQAIGLSDDQELVVVSSTWGPDGLFGRWPDLLPLLLRQLPAERFRVATLLHPAVWDAHGHRQVRAWLRDCCRAGLLLPDPAEDWRSLVVAADHLLGDHGSVTTYAAAIGRPVLRLPVPRRITVPGSPQSVVATRASRLDPRRTLLPQLRSARPVDHRAVTAALTARPGAAANLLGATMYRLLRLSRPGRHRRVEPVPLPRPDTWGAAA